MASADVDYFHEGNSEDLSYSDLDCFPEFLLERAPVLKGLQLDHNQISVLPRCVGLFRNLITLDISNNSMTYISSEITHLQSLRTLIARNNLLDEDAIPKDLGTLTSLRVLNLSGNRLQHVPQQVMEMTELKSLYIGSNQLRWVPEDIMNLQNLEVLYLGGNRLQNIPEEIGFLSKLNSLVLCDNRLQALPDTLVNLTSLQSLSLHNNNLSVLPPEIINLNLIELSLRNNPLVVKFVEDLQFEPPSLLELAGRAVKIARIPYDATDIPGNLVTYLDSAQCCVNPKCKGVYFTSRVEHVKFVDFCGKYRLPLLQYLCSPYCSDTAPTVCYSSESEDGWEGEDESDAEEVPVVINRMKKVLLG